MATRVNEVDKLIGARLRAKRMAAKISLQVLARKCGISYQQLQKYEAGKNRITASKLLEFSKLLDVPIEYFYYGISTNKPIIPKLLNDEHDIKIITAYNAIPRKIRKNVSELIEVLAKN